MHANNCVYRVSISGREGRRERGGRDGWGFGLVFTLSLSTLEGAKVATVVSGTWMGSPVRGLRAVRADRTEVPKAPKPTSDTVWVGGWMG